MHEFPTQLGVFPLPSVVLFPDALLPLHVFEPRYRSLVADCLSTHRHLVMAVLKPGHEEDYAGTPDVHEVGCVGRILHHEPYDDGRSDLVLRGVVPVRLRRFVAAQPFRVAEVEPVAAREDDCFLAADGAKARIQELHDLLELASPGCVEKLHQAMPTSDAPSSALELLHSVAMHLPVEVGQKLEWLACPGSLSRYRMIRKKLCDLAAARTLGKICLERYSDLCPEDPKSN